MDMSKKQAEFFTALIIICTVTAALILVIDYQIKGAILEESNRMRKDLETHYGQRTAAANGGRFDRNPGDNPAYPSDLVGSGTTGMEETSANGRMPRETPATPKRRPRAAREDGPSGVPGTGE